MYTHVHDCRTVMKILLQFHTPHYKHYPHLCGSNGVDKAGLLKPAIAGSDSNLPARVHDLMDHLSWEFVFVFIALTSKIELHIVLECLHLWVCERERE